MFNINELRIQIEALIRDNPDMEEDEQLRADMLDGETDIKGVLSKLLHAIDNDNDMIDVLDMQIDRRAARKARLNHRVDALRGMMLMIMQSADLKKLVLPEATLSQRNAQPKIVGNLDPNLLPDDLVRVIREPNKTAIREALNNHRDVPGVFLGNSPPYLAISTK